MFAGVKGVDFLPTDWNPLFIAFFLPPVELDRTLLKAHTRPMLDELMLQ